MSLTYRLTALVEIRLLKYNYNIMLKGAARGKFNKKKCGNRHAYCRICKPDRKSPFESGKIFGLKDVKVQEKCVRTRIKRKVFVAENNPNWRGGKMKYSLVGWKEARRKIWKRDKVCQLCFKKPRKRKLDVHHIVSRRDSGKDTLKNLVGLHHGCHMKVENGNVSESGLRSFFAKEVSV